MGKTDLKQIIAGCRNGDSESFSQLVDLYAGRCYGYFYRLTGSRTTSDDLLGELFVKLVEKFGSYRGGNFDSWLFRIASNVFYDHLRARQREERLVEAHKEHLRAEHAGKAKDDARLDRLQEQLGKLDEDVRELILLRYYSELGFKEIAEMRGEPIGTTLSKVHRGIRKLRELMG